jgi:hypothetical protein
MRNKNQQNKMSKRKKVLKEKSKYHLLEETFLVDSPQQKHLLLIMLN